MQEELLAKIKEIISNNGSDALDENEEPIEGEFVLDSASLDQIIEEIGDLFDDYTIISYEK